MTPGVGVETFALDPASNIASRTGPTATFSYDGATRLTSDGTRAFSCDGADRLIQRGADSLTGRLPTDHPSGGAGVPVDGGPRLSGVQRLLALAASLAIVTACAPSAQNGRVAVSAGPNTYLEAPSAQRAQAGLVDPTGSPIGSASFVEQRQSVRIELSVTKLPPGVHGVHLHAVGKCEGPDFASAGGHFNPTGALHGVANPKGPHAGDLPDLTVGSDGRGTLVAFTSLVDLAPGASQSLLRSGGTAIVIHASPDDQKTDPSGNTGARIACGVVKKVG